ncbi:MAG: 3-hydroxybutyryl-CoA dehydrogenase [Aequorivita sp.]|nr:3-hydroxybutyryl-CoA dehydrogenase [Aequorivita sp.]
MNTIGILGAGAMGSGIAQVAATAGHNVLICDNLSIALNKASKTIQSSLNVSVEKGKMTGKEVDSIMDRMKFADHMSEFRDCSMIIEAIVEDIELKQIAFKSMEAIVSEDVILASNTSSLSISAMGAQLKHPERILGIHFFNPAPRMRLVEIIPGLQTDKSVVKRGQEMISSWGKTTVLAKDTPGFIVNRVARPFYGEALRMYDEGIADEATIDWAMRELCGFRMGPFELMDFIGNDVNYTVTETVFEAFYFDPRYKPSFTQKRFSEAGYLGRKSGKGYYDYSENGKMSVRAQSRTNSEQKFSAEAIFERIFIMLINEAADALFWNIASAEDIDNAMTKGVNYPKGLLAWADEKGIDWCIKKMDELYEEYHETRYRCSPLLRKMNRENKTFF